MLYYKNFEDKERAEEFRMYLKKNAGIDLGKPYERSVGDNESVYEFETYGYPGFVMNMVYEIWFAGGIEYSEMGHLPQARKEKYLETELFSRALCDEKAWSPPSMGSRQYRWVSENLGLSEDCIRRVVQRAEKRYYRMLKLEKHYSLLIGLTFLILGLFFSLNSGPTSWPALLFFSFAVMLLFFCLAKTVQAKKKRRPRLP